MKSASERASPASHRHAVTTRRALRQDIGSLVTRSPLIPGGSVDLDPFLMVAHHGPQTFPPNNNGLPFGPHPHRGFETVTFILSGSVAHVDTGGGQSVIGAGGVQWMTAGAGIVHAEVSPPEFLDSGGEVEIVQLWLNLPGRLKMTPPGYSGLHAARVPAVQLGGSGAVVRLVAGEVGDVTGPIRSLTGVTMASVELPAGASVELPTPEGREVLLYIVRGAGEAAGAPYQGYELVKLAPDGDSTVLKAATDTVAIFAHADPIGEPVVAMGPFVMNSQAEIAVAYDDFRAGKFNIVDLPPVGR